MITPQSFLGGRVRLHAGDCRVVVGELAGGTIDACVCDPPYALVSIVKRFRAEGAAPAKGEGATGVYKRASSGFMGKKWDTGETAFDPGFWAEVGRVLKPGAHVVAFGGTRSYHRLACAIEDAGFEIRDQIGWAYGSGFPKSHNAGDGWGTALKPAWEPVILARKPLIGTVAANIEAHGTGALNVDGCRVGTENTKRTANSGTGDRAQWRTGNEAGLHGSDAGRWPANIVHDSSEEVLAAFPESDGSGPSRTLSRSAGMRHGDWGMNAAAADEAYLRDAGSGSAARFFYTAKADANDRIGSKHPTVKPVDLMRWLCRLVTPKGGTILDPFAGTGTTGEAAFYEGFNAILIEREPEYLTDIARRMKLAAAGPDERSREIAKACGENEPLGGLFA